MSHPRWSAAEFAAMVDSHGKLINQALKSPIEMSPPANLPRKRESSSINCEEFKCSPKVIQDLFNHLDLVDRALTHNYTATWLSWKPAKPSVCKYLGTIAASVLLRFHSAEDLVAFDVHAYLATDLRVQNDLLDPKTIFFIDKVHLSSAG